QPFGSKEIAVSASSTAVRIAGCGIPATSVRSRPSQQADWCYARGLQPRSVRWAPCGCFGVRAPETTRCAPNCLAMKPTPQGSAGDCCPACGDRSAAHEIVELGRRHPRVDIAEGALLFDFSCGADEAAHCCAVE